jgi:hypothetical protein
VTAAIMIAINALSFAWLFISLVLFAKEPAIAGFTAVWDLVRKWCANSRCPNMRKP